MVPIVVVVRAGPDDTVVVLVIRPDVVGPENEVVLEDAALVAVLEVPGTGWSANQAAPKTTATTITPTIRLCFIGTGHLSFLHGRLPSYAGVLMRLEGYSSRV